MKIYRKENVLEAAKARIRWLFDEFPQIVVNVSGGKDSTVVFHLALEAAREKGRLPLDVLFLDQEAEWDSTIEIIRQMMYHPDVNPRWFQMPFRLFNATSKTEHWLQCWDPEKEHLWVHAKDPISIKENTYEEDRFAKLFDAILAKDYGDAPACMIAGVRTEESPSRFMGLTYWPVWKGETWGAKRNPKLGHVTMHPLYDWSYIDIWKAIHEHGWPYSRVYDQQYQRGIPVRQMRVSNVHHETAVQSLFYMAELEPDTWNRITSRLAGVDMAQKMGFEDYIPRELPFMFFSWEQYRDYLLEKLIEDEDWRRRFRQWFQRIAEDVPEKDQVTAAKVGVRAILINDWEGITLHAFWQTHARDRPNRRRMPSVPNQEGVDHGEAPVGKGD